MVKQMSSIPGLTLESYVMWNHNLVVIGYPNANASLQIADALGINTYRVSLSQAQFDTILAIYEPYRTTVEYLLENFDDNLLSWTDYAGVCFNGVTDTIGDEVSRALHKFCTERAMKQLPGNNV
jgi:hypothetical protein